MNIKVKIENQIFDVSISDINSRPIQATVNGQVVEVWPEEMPRFSFSPAPVSAPISTPVQVPVSAPPAPTVPAAAPSTEGKQNVITAPIPGVIVSVSVKEGEAVKQGQELLVLEAMKMKNSIRSNHDGVISAVKVKVGDRITQRQVLVEYRN
jgi:biotin carboxyl carrier protein